MRPIKTATLVGQNRHGFMVIGHADQFTTPVRTRFFDHRITRIGAAVLYAMELGKRVRVIVIVSRQTDTARIDDEQLGSPTNRPRNVTVSAGQQADVFRYQPRQTLFNLCHVRQSGRFAFGCFQQIFDVAARTAMAQCHIMAQLFRPNLCRVQPGVRRISVRRQPCFDKRIQPRKRS